MKFFERIAILCYTLHMASDNKETGEGLLTLTGPAIGPTDFPTGVFE